MQRTELSIPGYERVVRFEDPATGLDAVIAIHSTVRGPALGGARFWSYDSHDDALLDALALSRGMTMKNSMADLPHGGGKSVINLKGVTKTPELVESFARAVDSLGGKYVTAEDVGCTHNDIMTMRSVTKHVSNGGEPSPATAFGVLRGIDAAVRYLNERDKTSYTLADTCVAIQGAGSVGSHLARFLAAHRASVLIADIDPARAAVVATSRPGIGAIPLDDILDPPTAKGRLLVFAPCALGPALRLGDVSRMPNVKIVCGSVNNALASGVEDELAQHGIIYVPDFVVNAGGVISVWHDTHGSLHGNYARSVDVDRIHDRVLEVLHSSPPGKAQSTAEAMAMAKIVP